MLQSSASTNRPRRTWCRHRSSWREKSWSWPRYRRAKGVPLSRIESLLPRPRRGVWKGELCPGGLSGSGASPTRGWCRPAPLLMLCLVAGGRAAAVPQLHEQQEPWRLERVGLPDPGTARCQQGAGWAPARAPRAQSCRRAAADPWLLWRRSSWQTSSNLCWTTRRA